jgi:hypothetical protein
MSWRTDPVGSVPGKYTQSWTCILQTGYYRYEQRAAAERYGTHSTTVETARQADRHIIDTEKIDRLCDSFDLTRPRMRLNSTLGRLTVCQPVCRYIPYASRTTASLTVRMFVRTSVHVRTYERTLIFSVGLDSI